MTVFRPSRSNRPRHRFKLQSKDIKQQGRTRPTGLMLRSHSCLQASRQPTDSVQDGWLSHIRTPVSPQPGREHAASMPMYTARPHTADGMVRSDWFMVGTRDVVTACRNVLSRSRRVLSCPWNVFHGVFDGLSTVPPQHCGNTPKTVLEGVWKAFRGLYPKFV